jgi:hypothetical protein
VQKQALKALAKAVAAGHVSGADASADRAEIARAAGLIRGLPAARGRPIAVALGQIAALGGKLTAPRAVAVFGQLKANDDYFAKHYPPAAKTDVTDADGIVYRYFAGRCLEFHPLANFGALNAHIAAKDVAATQLLADALVARGVYQPGGGIGWEYDFDYANGRAPWLSGMAQAVAAQAFARAAALVTDETAAFTKEATAAYRAISPRLLTKVPAGPWIRLYSFDPTPVLNAQLQTVISLQSYAQATGDAQAAAFATRMQSVAATTLARFDTGYWSLYDLRGDDSTVDYQQFVVQLLTRLGPTDVRFASAAQRFATYLKQPPAFRIANAGLGKIRFWLSKPASLRFTSAAGPTRRLALGQGWHTVGWPEPKRAGTYNVTVAARDWAGNSASFDALPIVRVTSASKPTTRKTATAGTVAQPSFVVGAGVDDPAQAPLTTQLGLRTVRMGLLWPAGATTPDPGAVAALQSLPPGSSLVLELFANPLPADDAGRAALASYTASLAQQVPALHQLVLEPSVTAATAAGYAETLAAVRAAVVASTPTVGVGAAIDGSLAPNAAVNALGRSLGGSPVDVVVFRPAPAPAKGAWTATNIAQLTTALTKALGAAPPILEDGLPSGSPAEAAQAVTAAACSPALAGVILDHIADGPPSASPEVGVFAADGTAKAGLATLTAAVATAQQGNQLCPGVALPAVASTLTYPTALAATAATSLQLGCVRDCLYLATVDRADGKPVVATRGALSGGAAPTTVVLPKTTLPPGTYRVDVRLVSQVNPGPVAQLLSPPLTVS